MRMIFFFFLTFFPPLLTFHISDPSAAPPCHHSPCEPRSASHDHGSAQVSEVKSPKPESFWSLQVWEAVQIGGVQRALLKVRRSRLMHHLNQRGTVQLLPEILLIYLRPTFNSNKHVEIVMISSILSKCLSALCWHMVLGYRFHHSPCVLSGD